MPGSKKCEIFARNNNLRTGWFSLGNQLGPQFDKWKNSISCDLCLGLITTGTVRYKSRKKANTDICSNCFGNVRFLVFGGKIFRRKRTSSQLRIFSS